MPKNFVMSEIFDVYRVEDDAAENGGAAKIWRVHHLEWDVDEQINSEKNDLILHVIGNSFLDILINLSDAF